VEVVLKWEKPTTWRRFIVSLDLLGTLEGLLKGYPW
jgi:hypothetical protein